MSATDLDKVLMFMVAINNEQPCVKVGNYTVNEIEEAVVTEVEHSEETEKH